MSEDAFGKINKEELKKRINERRQQAEKMGAGCTVGTNEIKEEGKKIIPAIASNVLKEMKKERKERQQKQKKPKQRRRR